MIVFDLISMSLLQILQVRVQVLLEKLVFGSLHTYVVMYRCAPHNG